MSIVRLAIRRIEIALLGLVDASPKSLAWIMGFGGLLDSWLRMQQISQVLDLGFKLLNVFLSLALACKFVIERRNFWVGLVEDADKVSFFHGASSEVLLFI